MKEIVLWRITNSEKKEAEVERIQTVNRTETENQLEEVITRCPGLLMEDLRLVGRQTQTPGGPLDLVGVDGDGRLVVFELKRGVLNREAVAQVIDYASYLAELEVEELSKHISDRSGNLGIEKIEDFLAWYQEQYGKSMTERQKPRIVLVGLGADDTTRRMISFLSGNELDISLTTFHGFQDGDEVFLARQVEVESKPAPTTPKFTKLSNLEKLQENVRKLGIEEYYYDMAAFFRDQLSPAYEWPNAGGYSYSLPELTETGSSSNRVYAALYINETQPRRVRLFLYPRAIQASSSGFEAFTNQMGAEMHQKNDGSAEILVRSAADWENLKPHLEMLCPAIVSGWKKKREQQSIEEFRSTSENSASFKEDVEF